MTVREPEWDNHERALMLAHFANEAEIGPYGITIARATAKDARFRASALPTVNKAVEAAQRAQDAYFKQYPQMEKLGPALMWSVSEVTSADEGPSRGR